MTKKPEPTFVSVIWSDAWKSATMDINLSNVAESHKPATMETRGWLMLQNEAGAMLAGERCLDDENTGDFRGTTFIPAAMIKSLGPWPPVKTRKRTPKVFKPDPQ